MPLPTSDLHLPVCMEMKRLQEEERFNELEPPPMPPLPVLQPHRSEPIKVTQPPRKVDHGSADSSDTFASCYTHTFPSEGDLAESLPDCVLDSNLYVNPLDGEGRVKKSTSGDTALRSLGVSPMEEGYQGFGASVRGSRGSLNNDTQIPKHRKARIQGVKSCRIDESARGSDESLESKKRKHLPSSRSLASATRIINQHLLGLQSLGSNKAGKQSGSRSSLSESGDSRNSPNLEAHRRSKSILKRADAIHQHIDPETEKLISDSTSGASVSLNSGKEGSPNKVPTQAARGAAAAAASAIRNASQTTGLRGIGPKTSTKPHALPIKFVGLPQQGGGEKKRRLKSPVLPLEDWWGGEKHARDEAVTENRNKERLESPAGYTGKDEHGCNSSQQLPPLYICPPPPPMEESSPTEETKLIAGPRTGPRT